MRTNWCWDLIVGTLRIFCSLTGIGKTTINTAVKNMEKNGLLKLKAIDGRSMGVYLTKEGRALMNNTVEKLISIENQIFDSWSNLQN